MKNGNGTYNFLILHLSLKQITFHFTLGTVHLNWRWVGALYIFFWEKIFCHQIWWRKNFCLWLGQKKHSKALYTYKKLNFVANSSVRLYSAAPRSRKSYLILYKLYLKLRQSYQYIQFVFVSYYGILKTLVFNINKVCVVFTNLLIYIMTLLVDIINVQCHISWNIKCSLEVYH